MNQPILKLGQLVHDYGDVRALDGIDLRLEPGEIYGFLGPNGAGKTTTLRIVAGLLEPTSGEVLITGLNRSSNHREINQQLAYLPDTPHVYPHLTVNEFLDVWLELHNHDPHTSRKRRQTLMERFRIADKRSDLTQDLSHGMRQKMLITGLALLQPRLYLIDEPLVGLDPYSQRQFHQLLREEVTDREAAVLLSSHSLPAVEMTCDRVGILRSGTLLQEGPPDELRQDPNEPLEEVFLRLTESS